MGGSKGTLNPETRRPDAPAAEGRGGETGRRERDDRGHDERVRTDAEHRRDRGEIADVTKLRMEAERRLDAGNNLQNLLDEYYAGGDIRKLENTLNQQEIQMKSGDILYLSGKWIAVGEKDGKKNFSLLGAAKSYDHLFRLLKEEAAALIPQKKEEREKLAREREEQKKNPAFALQQEFLKFLQAVSSHQGFKGKPQKLVDFLTRAMREISSQLGNLKAFSSAEDFSTKMRQALFRPFSLNISSSPAEKTFFEQLYDQGFKAKFQEFYGKIDQAGGSSGNALFDTFAQQLGYKDTGDMLSKMFEGLFEFLGPMLSQLGIAGKSVDKDLEKRLADKDLEKRRSAPHLKGKNPEYDASKLDAKQEFAPESHIQFVSKLLGLGADFHTKYPGEDGIMDYYLDLQSMGMSVSKFEMAKSEQFNKNLQAGDILFTTQVNVRNLHSYLGPLAVVSSVEGGSILVNYLPPALEEGKNVTPKNADLETFLNDYKASLYASVRPPVKEGVAATKAPGKDTPPKESPEAKPPDVPKTE